MKKITFKSKNCTMEEIVEAIKMRSIKWSKANDGILEPGNSFSSMAINANFSMQ